MVSTGQRSPIVVGVDGTADGDRAVRYAALEADNQNRPLRIVHIAPGTVPATPTLPLVSSETLRDVSSRIVDKAEHLVRATTDAQIAVEKVIGVGSRANLIAEAAHDAHLIVLGHRDRSAVERVFTNSTCTGVAARAHCPLVSVPAGWTQDDFRARVVVGVKSPAYAGDALAVAFPIAAERHVSLMVLHAWKLPNAYADIIASRVDADNWTKSTTTMLEAVLEEWQVAYPQVDVHIDVCHEYPAAALVDATQESGLIVLGRRGHGAWLGYHLGSIARTVIRESRCAVAIAPPSAWDEALPSSRPADDVSPQT